jgi:polyhydroxybutyrate depolymerase
MKLNRRLSCILGVATMAALLGATACSSGEMTGSGGSTSSATSTGTGEVGGGTSTGAGGSMTPNGTKGCDAPPAAKGDQMLTIDAGGTMRTYGLHVPDDYTAKKSLSLVFVFHERKSTGAEIQKALPIETTAAGDGIFVYPDGQPQAIANNDTGWDLQNETSNDVVLFDALLASLSDKYCIDSHRVFAAGFGYGGEFTDTLGCYRGDKLRGVAPIAGGDVFTETKCKGTPAAWIAHGQDDAVIGFMKFGMASRDFWVKTDGCGATTKDVMPKPCVEYQGCKEGAPVDFCAHMGLGGHVIPDFAAKGIWDFFSALAD